MRRLISRRLAPSQGLVQAGRNLWQYAKRHFGQEKLVKFFVDSADTDAIADLAATGMVDGVTTNPSLVAKSGRDFKELVAEICALVPGPVDRKSVV